MKKRVFKRSEKIDGSKSYIPDENLVGFLQDWLLIHQKKEQFTKDGKSLSKEDQLKIRALDKQKVDILDNMIFPALANLTYFFEAMAVSSRFSDAFADELEELLDPRKSKMMASAGSSMRMSSISFRRNNFARLIDAALDIKFEKFPDRNPVNDFRVGIMYQILNIVGDYMDRILSHEYSGNQIWKSFMDDYRRMQGWVALTTRAMEESPKEYDRKLGFEAIWFGNKSPNGGWKF